MIYKLSNKLFKEQYQYKIQLHVRYFTFTSQRSCSRDLYHSKSMPPPMSSHAFVNADKDYLEKLNKILKQHKGFFITLTQQEKVNIYSNSQKIIDDIANLDETRVLSAFAMKKQDITPGEIFLPTVPFDFKVTIRSSNSNHKSFVDWAINNKNIKISPRCITELNRDRSWGGTYFYVKGEKNLLLTKLHLGPVIGKIERVINHLSV